MKMGPGLENEFAASIYFLQDRVSGDISRKEVGSELNPLGIEGEQLGEGLDQFRFSQAREAFEQNMTTSEKADDHQFD